MTTMHWKQLCAGLGVLGLTVVMTGCGSGKIATASAPLVDNGSLTGRFMGGQQPIANTTVQLYESGVGGYGALATPLGAATHTNANGNFNLASYTCDPGRVLYIVGTGGQPIAATQNSAAITNSNISEVGIYGVCGQGVAPYINVNELSTIATVWALSPFMTDYAHVSTSSTNATGLVTAASVAAELVDPSTGSISRAYTPSNATLPSVTLNTLADMLEQCVNSGGGTHGDSSNCGNLFNLAPDAAGTTYPTDTITAALNIAKNPGRNVASLNRLPSASPVFQPVNDPNTPPAAWTVAITYTGGGMSSPSGIAVDGNGNVWLANNGNNSVTELDATGTPVSSTGYTPTGLNQPSAVAVDQQGNVWVTNAGNSSLVKMTSTGTAASGFPVTTISGANSVTIDQSGNPVLSNGSSVSSLDANGNTLNTYTSTGTVVGVVSTTK